MKRFKLLVKVSFPTNKVVLLQKSLYTNCLCKIYFQRIDFLHVVNLRILLDTFIFVSLIVCFVGGFFLKF